MRMRPSVVISSTLPGIARHIEILYSSCTNSVQKERVIYITTKWPEIPSRRGRKQELALSTRFLCFVLRHARFHHLFHQGGGQGLVRRELDRSFGGLVSLELLSELFYQPAAHREKAAVLL